MSKNIVFEGWLTKSPPSKRIWRTKWRRRWFALRQSGELPGQYFLDYYADRNCRRLKGTINLDFCEQVDAGLRMERTNQGAPDSKLRGSVFTIQTQSRTYHLEADCEAEMTKWVDAICSVCGLRATDEDPHNNDIYQNHSAAAANADKSKTVIDSQCGTLKKVKRKPTAKKHISKIEKVETKTASTQYDCDVTGPYIPISECITGVRAQDTQRAFTFDTKNIVTSSKCCHSTPQIRINNILLETSDNETNSEDECRSINTSQCNIGEVTVSKSFTRLNIKQPQNDSSEDAPPVPPRPPKTFALNKDGLKDASYHGLKGHESPDSHDANSPAPWQRYARQPHPSFRTTDDEDDTAMGHSLQYCNLSALPPAVDRALKPRHSSHNIGSLCNHNGWAAAKDNARLQYLDLDLHTSTPSSSNDAKKPIIIHGKSNSSDDSESAYKTVDFLKTEAFNITRKDAEAARNVQL